MRPTVDEDVEEVLSEDEAKPEGIRWWPAAVSALVVIALLIFQHFHGPLFPKRGAALSGKYTMHVESDNQRGDYRITLEPR